MATYESDTLIHTQDSAGNRTIHYPVTKADIVTISDAVATLFGLASGANVDDALQSAKSYIDREIDNIPTPDVSGQINTHNTNTSAHSDIRDLITGLTNRLNALADSDDTTLDQMSEIVDYIKSNKALIDSITTSKVNVSDIINNLTTNVSNKPLSAAQGVALKALVDAATTAAANAQSTANSKQAKITGTAGQFVVIGSDGNVTTKTVPDAEEASF